LQRNEATRHLDAVVVECRLDGLDRVAPRSAHLDLASVGPEQDLDVDGGFAELDEKYLG
jgi:hypothetical protein